MSKTQKSENFRRVQYEAGRERAERERSVENRLESMISFLDDLTSAQLANLPTSVIDRLQEVTQRIIAQAEASSYVNSDSVEE